MEIIIIILLSVLLICVIATFIAIIVNKPEKPDNTQLEQSINNSTERSVKMFSDIVSRNQQTIGSMQTDRFAQMDREIKSMRSSMEKHLSDMYKGFADISSLSSGVNDLRKVLSNVKTCGILGEIQLGAILKEILAPEQYEENVATVPGSSRVVEFAVKLPHDDDEFIYLPIDSKFPLDAYSNLQDAYAGGNSAEVESAAKVLVSRIKQFAKDIHTKYVEPPYTTDFAIMFLPTEGLYAEAVSRGLVEVLQRDYKINIAGPSTMAALLNSLQMGFKTLALEKRSEEVWKVLGEVKSEFEKFSSVLESSQKHINQVNQDIDKLIGVRMRAMERKLRNVEKMESTDFDED
ncbi:MAG: DNA recombination protein RmuC [Oscillospiraceae bacterium]|nr:DNA recombination protein RmuC [Oscillospiraceae bacterium]